MTFVISLFAVTFIAVALTLFVIIVAKTDQPTEQKNNVVGGDQAGRDINKRKNK